MKILLTATLTGGLLAIQLGGAELQVSLEIPRMNVAEYHRPYIAMWIEKPALARTLLDAVAALLSEPERRARAHRELLRTRRDRLAPTSLRKPQRAEAHPD